MEAQIVVCLVLKQQPDDTLLNVSEVQLRQMLSDL